METKAEPQQLGVRFGAMADPLGQQIHNQGLPVPDLGEMDHLQRDADALARLSVRSVLTEREAERARQRLFKKITAAVSRAASKA